MMPYRRYLLLFLFYLVLSPRWAGALDVFLQAETPVTESGCVQNFILNWVGAATETVPENLVSLQFRNILSGETWTDRHLPPSSIRSVTLENRRLAYTIPVFIPEQTVDIIWSVSVLIADAKFPDRLQLKSSAASIHRQLVQVIPGQGWQDYLETTLPELTGFHDPERDAGEAGRWRWMSGFGSVTIRNPGAPCRLRFDGRTPHDPNARVEIRINENPIMPESSGNGIVTIDRIIPADWFGTNPSVTLTIGVNKTFVPASDGRSTDTRELGIMIREFLLSIDTGSADSHPVFDLIGNQIIMPQWRRVDDAFSLSFANPGKSVDFFIKCRFPSQISSSKKRFRIQLLSNDIHVIDEVAEELAVRLAIPLEVIGSHPELLMDFILEPADTDAPSDKHAERSDGMPTTGSSGMIIERVWIK